MQVLTFYYEFYFLFYSQVFFLKTCSLTPPGLVLLDCMLHVPYPGLVPFMLSDWASRLSMTLYWRSSYERWMEWYHNCILVTSEKWVTRATKIPPTVGFKVCFFSLHCVIYFRHRTLHLGCVLLSFPINLVTNSLICTAGQGSHRN